MPHHTKWHAYMESYDCVVPLGRQIDPSRSDVTRAGNDPLRRAGYALLFTLLAGATALPSVSTILSSFDPPWEGSKHRFVFIGANFLIALLLALAAQFALVKPAKQAAAERATR